MRFRANSFIDVLSSPATAGKKFAIHLLDLKIVWRDLQIQLTGVPSRLLVINFWFAFLEEIKTNAPALVSDLQSVEWICDQDYQEKDIVNWLV